MPAKLVPWLLITSLAAALAGCSPQYRTFTAYTPPAADGGRQCLAQCQGSRQLCRQGVSLEVQQCRMSAQNEAQIENLRRMTEYQAELQLFQAGYAKHAPETPGTTRPNYWSCDNRASGFEEQCTADYDLCYQNCGGVVTYTTRCVANCEKEGY